MFIDKHISRFKGIAPDSEQGGWEVIYKKIAILIVKLTISIYCLWFSNWRRMSRETILIIIFVMDQ